jgi:uncharacterized DUF497 family protein
MVEFEFDPNKSALNRECHGIDFFEAQELWAADHVVFPSKDAREDRQILVAKLGGLVYIAIFTMRGPRVRLISCHRADGRWERIYASHVLKES